MSNKLDIKNELRAISTRDRNWYNSLTDEEKKKYDTQLWVQMRWASNYKHRANKGIVLQLVNEYTNRHFNTLRHHPQLQLQLLQLSGTGDTGFCYEWLAPGKRQQKNKLQSWVIENYPTLNDDEVELFVSMRDKADWKQLFEEHGMTDKQIKELLK